MREDSHETLTLDDGAGGRLHATWSRSGKRLIVTVSNPRWVEPRQVQLRPDQVSTLASFLSANVDR